MGGFCNVYSGMLRDGTLSPINMLHKEGYQGDRDTVGVNIFSSRS
ncbi:hypothetical protein Tco_0495318, partial [Tanacetum coccineum]